MADYHVEVDLTALPVGPQVHCTSTVRFASRREGAETFVDCCAPVVSATLNGRPVPGCSEGRIALGPLAADNVLIVESIQTDTNSGRGVHKAVDPADGEVYVWTSFEPDEARFVWACFDQPDLKAPYALTVLAPSGWKVVSNSGDPHVSPVSGDVQRWVFPPTPPLPTYLPVVLAGPFHEIRRDLDGYDLGVFARRSLRPLLERDAPEICTLTSQGLAFFGDRFGSQFPLRKYDQVFLPEYGGAMENYGCVAWSDGYLTRSEPSHAEREKLAVYLLHELAHMWFGNLVTMRWWDDLWLNETFAEFAALHAAERATCYRNLWASHLATAKLAAYRVDQGPTAHPIAQQVDDVAAGAANFDAIHLLQGRLGAAAADVLPR